MQTKMFIQFLLDNQMPVFTLDDAIKIIHSSRSYTKLFLYRCIKRKIIKRAKRGLYYVTDRTNEYEIASKIVSPCYISMVSALAYYGMTTQIPNIVYVISTKRHTAIKNIFGFDIIFKKVKKEIFFGYHKEAHGNIFMADPEKVIVDILYFNDVNDLDEDVFDKPSRLDIIKLVDYANKTGLKHIKLRVAKLLAEHGYKYNVNKLLKLNKMANK